MKKIITKSFSLFLALVMLVSCFAGFGIETFAASSKTKKVDGVTYTYTVTKDKAEIKYIAPGKKTKTVSIPSKLGGKTVTSIGPDALNWDENVKTVNIPNSVTKLCYSFCYCSKLSTINIGSGLKTIEMDAFPGCSAITKFTVDKKNKNFTTDNGSLYNKKKTKIVKYTTGKKTKEVKLPKSVTSIGYGAFSFSLNLEKITIPSDVKTIPEEAFGACEKLKTAKIPSKVTTIGAGAFSGTAIKSVTIPSKVKTIGDGAFLGTAIKSVTIPKSVTKMGYNVFAFCTKLTSADLSKTKLKSIKAETFSSSEKLVNVKLPNTITQIGDMAFFGTGIKSFNASKNINKIGHGAFSFCKNLKSVDLSKTKIKVLNGYAFDCCEKLETVKLPSSVTEIGYSAFSNTAIKSFTASKNLKKLGFSAFENCKKLTSVDLSKSQVKELSDSLFYSCTQLEKIKFPKNLTSINYDAFYNTGIKSIKLPDTISYIPENCFRDCKKLETVTLPNKLKSISYEAFAGCKKLKKITIPASVNYIDDYAFDSIKEVTFKGKDTSFSSVSFNYDVTIKAKEGSEAQYRAEDYGYTFVAI